MQEDGIALINISAFEMKYFPAIKFCQQIFSFLHVAGNNCLENHLLEDVCSKPLLYYKLDYKLSHLALM